MQIEFLGNVLDRRRPAAPSDVTGKALGVERVSGQEVELLALHVAAALAVHPPHFELEIDPPVAAGQVAYLPSALVVPARLRPATAAAFRFLSATQDQ